MCGSLLIARGEDPAVYTPCYLLESDKDEHFTEEIAQGCVEKENLAGLNFNKITITRITIQSKQLRNFEVYLFGKDAFEEAALEDDSFQTRLFLNLTSRARQIGGAGQWYYSSTESVDLDYEDEDGTKELHVAFGPRYDAGTKPAGAAGAVKLTFTYVKRGT